MKTNYRTLAALCLSVAALLFGFACDGPSAEHADHDSGGASETEHHHDGEPGHRPGIVLTDSEMAEFGIELGRAAGGAIEIVVELPGEVRPDQDRLAHLVPRFSGIVKRVRKRVGDSVREGEVLALIESSESLSSYGLKSLIDGTVIDKHITRGEAVSTDTVAFIVADLSTVWVDLSVYQRDLDRVKVGQKVVISAGPQHPEAEATVAYVAPVIDEATRTAIARVILPNPEGIWRPGLFVTGRVSVQTHPVAIAVPRAALQTVGGRAVLFVPDSDGLEPRAVTVGRSNRDTVEILAGMSVGDRYVRRGSFTLKSELDKAGFEAGHAH